MQTSKLDFKKGDRVYVAQLGWGDITEVKEKNYVIDFYNDKNVEIPAGFVSRKEYDFSSDFIQQDVDGDIGKLCYFWDDQSTNVLISKLKSYDLSADYPYEADFVIDKNPLYFENYKRLSEADLDLIYNRIF